MKKYNRKIFFEMDPIDVYKLVLEGKVLKRFPFGYWQQAEATENGILCIRYLIDNLLKLDEEELKKQLSKDFFTKHKLAGMLQHCMDNSPYKAINLAYPNKYKEWEFKHVPVKYWSNRENAIKCIKWLIEDKLKLSCEELKNTLSYELFEEYRLTSMLTTCFNSSPYEAINAAYPNKYKEWEFKYVPMGYWSDTKNGIKATKWLIEEKLKLNDTQIKESVCSKLFIDHGLSGMIQNCFNNSPYEAINTTYPNRFKRHELRGYLKNNNK